jgi:hypothetical protein
MSRPEVGDTIVIADRDFFDAVMHARSIMGANWQGSKACTRVEASAMTSELFLDNNHPHHTTNQKPSRHQTRQTPSMQRGIPIQASYFLKHPENDHQ